MSSSYRELPPEDKAYLRRLRRRVDRNFIIATTALVLALLMGLGLGLGFGLGLLNDIRALETAERATNMRISALEVALLESMMNSTTGVTTRNVQSGTFIWDFGTATSAGTFSVDEVQLGTLNFTVLELSPPASPYLFPGPAPSRYSITLDTFSPTPMAFGPSGEGAFAYALSQTNAERASVSNGCLASAACSIFPTLSGAAPNAINVERTPGNSLFIEFTIGAGSAVVGETFTLTEAWRLIVPSI